MFLRVLIQFLLGNLLIIGCRSKQSQTALNSSFHTIDYVTVGQRMSQVQTPYIIDVSGQSKRLVFVGCDHIRDSTNVQFKTLQYQFTQLKPQITFNEGGAVNESRHFSSLNKAAYEAGETGCMKYLSDQSGIRLLNGDTPEKEEFTLALHHYPKQELYLYYVMERIVIPFLSIENHPVLFERYFQEGVDSFVRHGFPLAPTEQSLAYFKLLYHQYMKRPFALTLTEEVEQFDYLNGGNCHFCAIGRRSKMIRDSILLTKLDQALNQYDRVMVTFGCGHALAIEPALIQLINKKRENSGQ